MDRQMLLVDCSYETGAMRQVSGQREKRLSERYIVSCFWHPELNIFAGYAFDYS